MRRKRGYILLDANVLVAYIDNKDAHHERAKEAVFSLAEKADFVVLLPVLGEAYSVIARRCRERKYDCRKALQALKALDILLIKEDPVGEYHWRVVDSMVDSPELNYNDWLIVLYALDRGLRVLSFDYELSRKLQELKGGGGS